MGRKSTKENKNIYHLNREELGISRADAQRLTQISSDRITDIENGKTPHPDEVVAMANGYKNPFLCNYYCARECAIGYENVVLQEEKLLSQISIQMVNTLNHLEAEKNRFIEIVEDEEISPYEQEDFERIQRQLQKMESLIDSLQLWIKDREFKDKISNKYNQLR